MKLWLDSYLKRRKCHANHGRSSKILRDIREIFFVWLFVFHFCATFNTHDILYTAQNLKDFFSKCDHIRMKQRIWSYLLKKSLMENFIFIEITLWHGCSPVNLLHIFRTPFLKNTSRWLLLFFFFNVLFNSWVLCVHFMCWVVYFDDKPLFFFFFFIYSLFTVD